MLHVCVMFQMGVHEVGLRKSILKHIDFYREKRDDEAARMKAKKLEEPYEVCGHYAVLCILYCSKDNDTVFLI